MFKISLLQNYLMCKNYIVDTTYSNVRLKFMYEKLGQFINGKWQQSSDKGTYDVINPATEEIIGQASKATSEDVELALKSAEKGLEIWRKTPPWHRSNILRKIADTIRLKKDVLAKWMTLENGKPLA